MANISDTIRTAIREEQITTFGLDNGDGAVTAVPTDFDGFSIRLGNDAIWISEQREEYQNNNRVVSVDNIIWTKAGFFGE